MIIKLIYCYKNIVINSIEMSSLADASEADDEYASETDLADPYKELLLFEEIYIHEEQQSAKRDEFIYTRVFNNHNIGIEILIDFNLGTMDDWSKTCEKFNSGAMILAFATLHIIIYNSGPYNCVALKCDNIHPFVEMNKHQDEMTRLSNMLCANVIHD